MNAAATYFNYRQNHKAMHAPQLGLSPNILVTYIYTLAKKHFPEDNFWPDMAIKSFSILPIVVPEILQLSELFIPGGPTAALARNIAGAIGQAFQAGYVQYRIERARRTKPNEN